MSNNVTLLADTFTHALVERKRLVLTPKERDAHYVLIFGSGEASVGVPGLPGHRDEPLAR
jgi:hypothetical protein